MKILALVFLFGVAAAISHEALERARDEALLSFVEGMEKAPSLREAMNMPFAELDEIEDDIKGGLVKALRDALNTLLEKVKKAVEDGNIVKEEMREHIEKIKDELRKLHKNIGVKARELLERIKEKAKGKISEWLKKLGIGTSEDSEAYQVALTEESKLRKFLENLRDKLKEAGANLLELKHKIIEEFGEKSMMAKILLKDFTEKRIQKVKDLLDNLLNKKDSRAVKDLYEKIKDYLKEVRGDFEHHFSTFLDWLENVYKSGADAAKGRIENVKKVAEKFLEHVKDVGKKTADEALEFFRPYQKDLGTLWNELEKSIKEAYGDH